MVFLTAIEPTKAHTQAEAIPGLVPRMHHRSQAAAVTPNRVGGLIIGAEYNRLYVHKTTTARSHRCHRLQLLLGPAIGPGGLNEPERMQVGRLRGLTIYRKLHLS